MWNRNRPIQQPVVPTPAYLPVAAKPIDEPIPPAIDFSAAVNAPVMVTLYKNGQPVSVAPEAVDDLLGLGYQRMPVDLAALAERYRVFAQAAIQATALYYSDAVTAGVISREIDGAKAAAERANADLADAWLQLHYWMQQHHPTPESVTP